jgi:hypothetical protein
VKKKCYFVVAKFSGGEGRLEQQRSEKFYLQRRERKDCMGSCSGTQKLVVPWVRLEIGFSLPKGRDFGGIDVKGEVSPWYE